MPPVKQKSTLAEIDLEEPVMVLTRGDMDELGKLARKHLSSRDDLFRCIRSMGNVSVEGVEIQLDEKLLMRLKTRCLDKNNFPRWLRETVIRQMHDFAGW